MKKTLFWLLGAALCLTACDEKGQGGTTGGEGGDDKPETEVTATVTYDMQGGADITTVLDITASYTDADGKEVTVEVASLPWQAVITGAKVPFTADLKVELSPKESFEEKEQYQMGLNTSIGYKTSDGQFVSNNNVSHITISKDDITRYITEKVLTKDYNKSVSITKK